MLKKLKELRESLNGEQEGLLRDALPGHIVESFFSAGDEGAARILVQELNQHLGKHPLVAFKLYKGLSSEQRELISDLAFDDDDEEEE